MQDTANQTVTFQLNVAVGGPTVEVTGVRIAEPTYDRLPDELQDESNVDSYKFCSRCAGVVQSTTQLNSPGHIDSVMTPPLQDPEKSSYAITISASQSARVGSEVTLHITTKNISDKIIYRIVRSGGPHGRNLDISVRDSKGNPVQETEHGREIQGTELNRQPSSDSVFKERYPLRPGEVLEENLNLSEEYDFSKPGRYSIQVRRSDIVTEEEIRSHSSPQAVKSNTATTLIR